MAFTSGNYTLTYKGHDFKVYFEMNPEQNQVLIPPIYGDEDNGVWDVHKIQYNLEDLGKDINVMEKGLAYYDGELNHDAICSMLENRFISHVYLYDDLTQPDKDLYFKTACVILRYLLESLGKFDKGYFYGYAIMAYNKIDTIRCKF